jgi:cysteinyl-tRNA synthetase
MAGKYLGPAFDIHGGGLDLIFPHHENEIAQSQAAGDRFAQYWMHNAWVTLAGEKMSKSLGNTVLVSEMAKRWRPVELRYYLGAAHYRSMIEYSADSLDEAAKSFRGVENFLARARDALELPVATEIPDDFAEAMDDDLAVPRALAVLHNRVRTGNAALASGSRDVVEQCYAEVSGMIDVLGLNMPGAGVEQSDRLTDVVDQLIALALAQRQAARERKDFKASDAIRDSLTATGVVVEDTPDGPRWKLDDH